MRDVGRSDQVLRYEIGPYVPHAATASSFVAWVRRSLVPQLRPGDIVVLDDLRAHKDARVRRLLARVGARLRFLPRYS